MGYLENETIESGYHSESYGKAHTRNIVVCEHTRNKIIKRIINRLQEDPFSQQVVNQRLETTTRKTSAMMRWVKMDEIENDIEVNYSQQCGKHQLIWSIGDLIWFSLVLWHFNHCRLFNAKSIFIHINSSISNNSV